MVFVELLVVGGLDQLVHQLGGQGVFDPVAGHEAINRQGLELIEPHIPNGSTDLRALWGALHHEAAYTAVRAGQRGDAWRWWEQAETIARRLPPSYYEPMTSFSRVIMGPHAVTIAVEARQGGEARKQAAKTANAAIPSQPRKGRHLIEVARAWRLSGDHKAALGTLNRAYAAAPETIRYNGLAKRITLELTEEASGSQKENKTATLFTIGAIYR